MAKIGKDTYVEVTLIAKLKVVFQMVGIFLLIISSGMTTFYFYEISMVLISIGVLFGLYSAINYFSACIPYLKNSE